MFEHVPVADVPVADLPPAWREKLTAPSDQRVTVRIEAETETAKTPGAAAFADDPLFGMWRDRDDMADVEAYVRRLRAARFNRDGLRNEP